MKCPKCQYIGFAQEHRCRNCGYDFSLSVDFAELDLPIKTGDEAIGPLADFTLSEGELDPGVAHEPSKADDARTAYPTPAPPELPLFRDRALDDDAPLVSLPAAPRAPVSVRKSASARPAPSRPAVAEPTLDLEPDVTPSRMGPVRRIEERTGEQVPGIESATAGARLLGALIDLVLLGSIDLAVLYFTLRLLGLEFSEARSLPIVPFTAFLALLNGGYLAAFTAAGGQTIGKMAAGTRVVTADESAWMQRVPLGQAVVRAAAYLVSALPAGLGFLPAILGTDGRAVHDRLAHTRVVRV